MSELDKPWLDYKSLRITRLADTKIRHDLSDFSTEWAYERMGMRAYDQMARIANLHVLRKGEPDRLAFRCAQFGFSTVKQESWAKEDQYLPIFFQPLEYLWRRGYEPLKTTDLPENGDLVAYGTFFQGNKEFNLGHLGLIDGDGVVSKFNYGHVFYHTLDKVPHIYGDRALYFRKAADRYQVTAERNGISYDLPFSESRPVFVTSEGHPLPDTGIIEAKSLTPPQKDFLEVVNSSKDVFGVLQRTGYKAGSTFRQATLAVYTAKDVVVANDMRPTVSLAKDGKILLTFPDSKPYWVPLDKAPNSYGNVVTFYDR